MRAPGPDRGQTRPSIDKNTEGQAEDIQPVTTVPKADQAARRGGAWRRRFDLHDFGVFRPFWASLRVLSPRPDAARKTGQDGPLEGITGPALSGLLVGGEGRGAAF